MQSHERIGVVPVAARPMMSVHNHHAGMGLVKQHIGERHAHRTAAYDEVIGFHNLGMHLDDLP